MKSKKGQGRAHIKPRCPFGDEMNFDNYSCDNQMSIFDFVRRPISITKPIRLIELFAGYGSQAMALKRICAKFEHYRVVEFDKFAIASYNAIHGTDFQPADIKEIHAAELAITDTEQFTYLLTYSFPCTDLSVAGKQMGMSKGSGTRSGLLWEVERILTEIIDGDGELPQILFMENVPQVHGKKNIEDFKKWIDFLERLGYTNYWQDLNAKNYGVAQNRNRCFMFSFLGDYSYQFPEPRTSGIPAEQRLEVNTQGTSNCLTSVQKDNLVIESQVLTPKRTEYGKKIRKAYESGEMKESRHKMTELEPRKDGVSNTLTTVQKDNLVIEQPEYRIRKLTPRECGRLMGVSDEDISQMAEVNSNSQLYKQFGNSIVVDAMCAMFKNLNIKQK